MVTNGKRQLDDESMRVLVVLSVPFRHPELKLLSIQNLKHCLKMLLGVRKFQVMNAIFTYVIAMLVLRSMESTGIADARNRS